MLSNAPDIFIRLAREIVAERAQMTRHSPTDKEYFLQDWFEATLRRETYTLQVQGRNSAPDYLVSKNDLLEGFELKSLANTRPGRDPAVAPCRTDVDFNSHIPCGYFARKPNHRLPAGLVIEDGTKIRAHYLFMLYEGVAELEVEGIAMVLTDGDFLNCDFELAESHENISQSGFGSYGDAWVRHRKMYRFPNPLTEPDFRYQNVFVTKEPNLEKDYPVLYDAAVKEKVEIATGTKRKFYVYRLKP